MTIRQASILSLTLENVAVYRGNRVVLHDLSLSAASGEILWIRGANGCGKSTLLRLIAGLLTPESGRLAVEGRMALADENLALDPNLTVRAALNFWAKMDDADAEMLVTAMTDMDLESLRDVPVRLLSTGQRKRASIARVLASNAGIWLLDEPYNGLDSASCARLDQAITRHAESGGIILVAAHQHPSINVSLSLVLDRAGLAV